MEENYIEKLNMPVIAAPLFLISGPKLVIECCKNGIVGTFPSLNQRSTEGFEEWVIQIKNELDEFEQKTGKKAEEKKKKKKKKKKEEKKIKIGRAHV